MYTKATFGTTECVLIIEVSLFQSVLIREVTLCIIISTYYIIIDCYSTDSIIVILVMDDIFTVWFVSPLALPDIEIISSSMEVQNNDTVKLDCFADGSPIQDVHWTLTDQARGGIQLYTIQYIIDNTVNRTGHVEYIPLVNDIDEDIIREKFTIAPPDLSVSTRLYGQLTIKNITPFEAGAYNCTLINKFDQSNATITVDVQCKISLLL